jgi:hypothetical protein
VYKQSILEESLHFGNQRVDMTQYLAKPGRITAFYEVKTGGESPVSIKIDITPEKELIEAKITNKAVITKNNERVSVMFDSSGNLVKGSYPAEYEKMAREYDASLKSILKNQHIKTKSQSPQEAFKPLAANVANIPASEFSKIALVQHYQNKKSLTIYIPPEIVQKYDLKDGQMAYWKVIGDRLTLRAIKGEHENVTQFFQKTPLRVDTVIPVKIQREANIHSGMSFKPEKITEGENRYILLIADEQSHDIRTYGKGRLNLTMPSKSQMTGDIEKDTMVDWATSEKGILLELLGSHPHSVKLSKKGAYIQLTVPKSALTELVGSSIDPHDITPKWLQIETKIKDLKKAEWIDEKGQIFLKPILE